MFDLYINGEKSAFGVSIRKLYFKCQSGYTVCSAKWVRSDLYNGVYGSRNCFGK